MTYRTTCDHLYADTEEVGHGRVLWTCQDCGQHWTSHTDDL